MMLLEFVRCRACKLSTIEKGRKDSTSCDIIWLNPYEGTYPKGERFRKISWSDASYTTKALQEVHPERYIKWQSNRQIFHQNGRIIGHYKKDMVMLPNSAHISLINKDTDVLLDRKMLHEQVNEMTTSIFDKEVGLIMFDCTNTYSDECLSTRIISNKIQGKV